jgi:hypothetical protein
MKVFGCPCQFSPMSGPEHKRASKIEWGYFVGMQWPICLVYKPDDNKVISVSRMKLVCHEGMYAYFDSTKTQIPKATIQELDTTTEIANPQQEIEAKNSKQPEQEEEADIDGVHSVKILREASINASTNEVLPPPPLHFSQLENFLDDDSLQEKIKEFKKKPQENAESQYHSNCEST